MTRKCGTCSACCRWPSVPEIDKPARVTCPNLHKQGFGCTIYAERPETCSAYQCAWLRGMGAEFQHQDRPDTCHVLIDRRFTQYGHMLVAKSLKPEAAMSPNGKRAIERTTKDEGMPCLVIDDDEKVIGVAGPDDLRKEVEANLSKGNNELGGQSDWVTNIIAAANLGKIYPGLDHGG